MCTMCTISSSDQPNTNVHADHQANSDSAARICRLTVRLTTGDKAGLRSVTGGEQEVKLVHDSRVLISESMCRSPIQIQTTLARTIRSQST
jgi:hypothetical protein